jgi:riboflavin synthase alpha subunit
VALIPTTVSRTTLADLTEGDEANLETDILARTVVHTLENIERSSGLTEAKLREHGFL